MQQNTPMQQTWQLRSRFARRLSERLDNEDTGYTALVDLVSECNAETVATYGEKAERMGSAQRVGAEQHAEIRVGSPAELAEVGRIFAALGMFPTGFYDLRDLSDGTVPIIATTFRPNDPVELERSPFRVFAALLTTTDRQFFSADQVTRIGNFLDSRELFPPRLLALADRARAERGLEDDEAQEFLKLATETFTRPAGPVDKSWVEELAGVSSVAAEIAGGRSSRIHHLAPRVLDLDAFCARMAERGFQPVGGIQGPPSMNGPDVLLRQATFASTAEGPVFKDRDGNPSATSLKPPFLEVETRGIALTRLGRQVYDAFGPMALPDTEEGLAGAAFGLFTMTAVPDRVRDGRPPAGDLSSLLAAGWLVSEPVIFEDFLPESAAAIFRAHLTSGRPRRAWTARHATSSGPLLNSDWLAGVLGQPILDPDELYWLRSTVSEQVALKDLGLGRR
jgi:uncharacterized glyoxalase superfamily metalloenzyme YdcJ